MIPGRHFAGLQLQGGRPYQEDDFGFLNDLKETDPRPSHLLVVLADGMGGHSGGAHASALAVDTFLVSYQGATGSVTDRMVKSLNESNDRIRTDSEGNPQLAGMGCTLVGAWIDAEGLRWVSVGDSLLLLFRAPKVLRLNADHSLGAFLDEQVRRNRMSAAEAAANPHRNALRSALTGKAIEILDLAADPYPLADGDWLVLASDGLATLTGNEIGDIVYAARDAAPERMAEKLISAVLAKEDPEQDNTTALVLRIAGDAARVAADEAPTRILRPEATLVAALLPDEGDRVATTRRIVLPPAYEAFLRRHGSVLLGLGMVAMFAIGWLLRALLG
ncbi:MAG: serine/threonine-protein phosphatase, partial [Bauldia sp.]